VSIDWRAIAVYLYGRGADRKDKARRDKGENPSTALRMGPTYLTLVSNSAGLGLALGLLSQIPGASRAPQPPPSIPAFPSTTSSPLPTPTMPHKHTRRRSTSPTAYDLPPTSLARPLPTFTSKVIKPKPLASKAPEFARPTGSSKPTTSARPTNPSKPASSRPTKTPAHGKAYTENDTPRAFTRLMTYRPPPRSGLDDGHTPPNKKRKRDPPSSAPPTSDIESQNVESQQTAKPHILPGESMSAFSARVDAALPVRGLTAKGKKMQGGGRQTKTERKMQRMQREWRVGEERRRAKRAEMREEGEDGDAGGGRKGGGKGGRRIEEEEGDLWAGIAAKPLQGGGGGGLVGLHDVVLAPPKFEKALGEMFKIGGGGKCGGVGLKRQAELGEARRKAVEGYRALMRQRGMEGDVVG